MSMFNYRKKNEKDRNPPPLPPRPKLLQVDKADEDSCDTETVYHDAMSEADTASADKIPHPRILPRSLLRQPLHSPRPKRPSVPNSVNGDTDEGSNFSFPLHVEVEDGSLSPGALDSPFVAKSEPGNDLSSRESLDWWKWSISSISLKRKGPSRRGRRNLKLKGRTNSFPDLKKIGSRRFQLKPDYSPASSPGPKMFKNKRHFTFEEDGAFGANGALGGIKYGNEDKLFIPGKVSAMKDKWVAEEVTKCKDEFTVSVDVDITCITWNVNARGEDPEEFQEFLATALGGQARNIVAVGFQEIVELSPMNVIADTVGDRNNTGKDIQQWQATVHAGLNGLAVLWNSEPYLLLESAHLVGICLFVFVQDGLQSKVQYTQKEVIPTGVGGILGNKGGIAIRFDLFSSSICFVCAHFAAHRNAVQDRNEEYRIISSKPCFLDLELNPQGRERRLLNDRGKQRIKTTGAGTVHKHQASDDTLLMKRRALFASENKSARHSSDSFSERNKDVATPSRSIEWTPRRESVPSPARFSAQQKQISSGSNRSAGTGTPSTTKRKVALKMQGNNSFDVGYQSASSTPHSSKKSPVSFFEGMEMMTVLDHDYVFWMGDLNYRMIETASISGVINMAQNNYFDTLINFDQLLREKNSGKIFQGFEEGLLAFAPTYKFIPGTHEYDQRPEKKVRCPAWTDRILYRARPGYKINQQCYNSGKLKVSDHKPVYSQFNIQLQSFDDDTREAMCSDIMRRWEEWEVKNITQATIVPDSVWITQINEDQLQKVALCLNNTSSLNLLDYEFDANFLPTWVIPPTNVIGTIAASGSEMITLEIDGKLAHREGQKNGYVASVIVICIASGNDICLPIHCQLTT